MAGIGGVSGAVVAGAIFTLPALYSLNLSPHPAQTIFICLAGGCLGVLFLIPLRRYFVREMHGQFPYPEATAITEVLVTGEKGGSQAKLLLQATGIAAAYDFVTTTPVGAVPSVEWLELRDDRIASVYLLFDKERWPEGQGAGGPLALAVKGRLSPWWAAPGLCSLRLRAGLCNTHDLPLPPRSGAAPPRHMRGPRPR